MPAVFQSNILPGEEDIPWKAFGVSPMSFYLQGLPKLVHLTCFSVVSSEHMVASEPWGKCLYFTCKAAAEPCNEETPSLPYCCSCKPCVVFHLSHLLLFHPETWKRSLLTLISPIRISTNLFFFFFPPKKPVKFYQVGILLYLKAFDGSLSTEISAEECGCNQAVPEALEWQDATASGSG